MALDVQDYPGSLAPLPDALRAALATFSATREREATFAERAIDAIGPFPVYTVAPSLIEADDEALQAAVRVGWRGLVTADREPLAIADITFSAGATERFDVRGPEAAIAFYDALRLALRYDDDDRRYDVRLLAIPDIYVSALWLDGATPIFVPTRLGGASRPEIQEMEWRRLRETMLPLIEAARGPPEVVGRERSSPRSGLPRNDRQAPEN